MAEAFSNLGYSIDGNGIRPDSLDYETFVHNCVALLNSQQISQVIEKIQNVTQFKVTAELNNILGTAYALISDPSRAIASYKKAIEIDPEFSMAYINLCKVYNTVSQFADAVRAGEKAISVNPKSLEAVQNLSMAYFNVGRIEKAEETISKVGGSNHSEKSLVALGRIKMALGKLPDADAAFQKLIEKDPKNPNGYFHLLNSMRVQMI